MFQTGDRECRLMFAEFRGRRFPPPPKYAPVNTSFLTDMFIHTTYRPSDSYITARIDHTSVDTLLQVN